MGKFEMTKKPFNRWILYLLFTIPFVRIIRWFIEYKYIEILFCILLFTLFIIALKAEKDIVNNIFGICLLTFLFYSLFFALDIEENKLFNFGVAIIILPWIIVFNQYFKLKEEKLPVLDSFLKRRKSYETLATLIYLVFLKVISDIQIFDIEIHICKEGLSQTYGIASQVFGTILSVSIAIAIFIVGYEKIENHRRAVLIRGLKGIVLLAIPIILLSIIGVMPDMDLYIGGDMSSFGNMNTIFIWIFFMTILMVMACISFIGMLIYNLLEVKSNEK
ncbi:MAG: hypothetical protein WA977_05065 [Halobacteriota archaeon]